MSHTIEKTSDGSQDTCLTCGQVGNLSEICPQPAKSSEKKTTNTKK